MRYITGQPVVDESFFVTGPNWSREALGRDGNHVLLTGRRPGRQVCERTVS